MGFLSDLTGVTAGRLAGEARKDAQNRERISLDVMNNAYNQGRPYLEQARNQWDELLATGQRYGNAGNLALSALGVTDPALAQSAFRASPGYDFQVNQGLEAAARRANSLGMAPSGNTMAELQRLGQGYASQEWNNWVNQLQGLAQLGAQTLGQATAGRSGALTNLGNYTRDYGRDAVGIVQQTGQAVQNSMNQEANARMQGAGRVASLGVDLAKAVMGSGGLGGFLQNLPYGGFKTPAG